MKRSMISQPHSPQLGLQFDHDHECQDSQVPMATKRSASDLSVPCSHLGTDVAESRIDARVHSIGDRGIDRGFYIVSVIFLENI